MATQAPHPSEEPVDPRLAKGLRPFGVTTPPATVLPTRRNALEGVAALGVAIPFATAKDNRPSFNSPIAGGTPEVIREMAAGSYPNGHLNVPTGTWIAYQTDRPVILTAVLPDDTPAGNINRSMGLWYNYGTIPSGSSAAEWNWSHAGIAYLSSPGTWFLRAQSGFGTNSVAFAVIDAFDWGVKYKYLTSPGANMILQSNVNVSSSTVTTVLLSPQRGRVAARLQNVNGTGGTVGTTGIVRLSFDMPATYLETAAPNGRGWALGFRESILLTGDYLTRGTVLGILDSAPGNTTTVEILDYYDWI